VAKNLKLPTLFDLLERAPAGQRNTVITESLEQAFAKTKKVLGDNVGGWRWGSIHHAMFEHPLANNEARAAVLNRGPVERGGDAYTPNRSPGPNYSQIHGASYRHILDFADWDRSVFTSVPGQSGQPGSPHYSDLLELWGNYDYAPLVYSREAVEANTANKLMLEPAPPRSSSRGY
ncbi:MAG TPA: penicillin acylase family protein, partial [Bryobacterales bacterium]|nr:penicillin acylase family protein [Bryobacterales bacterium]